MRMTLQPDLADLAPGDEAEFHVAMANDGSDDVQVELDLQGLDADLWTLANPIPVIPAGQLGRTTIRVRLPEDATPGERAVLGRIRYHGNKAVLHTDASAMPTRRRAWAAWNYERAGDLQQEQAAVCLHYWINRLQPLPWETPVVVSLNPAREPDPGQVIEELAYDHPVFDQAAIAAQTRLHAVQGRSHVWFCGAWTRYGFHEDGLISGMAVAQALRERIAADRLTPRAA